MRFFLMVISFLLVTIIVKGQQNRIIYKSDSYTIYNDKIVQGKNIARALSSTELTSNYSSPANQFKSPVIEFKFSINGKDNEMIANVNHEFLVTSKNAVTPVIKFGTPDKKKSVAPASTYLQQSATLTIRVDMRDVLRSFDSLGYYVTFHGDKIYKNDFKGLFVAGNAAPLIWDFNNLINHPELQLHDGNGTGIYETTLVLNKPGDEKSISDSWKLTRDITAFPQYTSDYIISDAIYNLALEETEKAVEADSTFRTGKEWGGVWTRDISYSIILAMAVLEPKVAIYSLMRKVKNGVVVQDTGTGGAYPVSSDRMIWAVAAFEVYKVTGDKAWLSKAYEIIKRSAEDDLHNVYDTRTGLVRGESSFLDWREETYPRWMQPADIYGSECLGTNVIHFQVNNVLAEMSAILGNQKQVAIYQKRAASIKAGLLKYLWQPSKGYFGQYLYGRNYKSLSSRSEALGEALSVIFDAASKEQQLSTIKNAPVTDFGVPCIYPEIPNILPYHNNAVWPFVESFFALASAKVGNEESVTRAISAIYRPAAMFLTNKENFVATDGDYAGTQINSSNMLWSLSGSIALVYKIFFGMHFNANSLELKPFVPKAFAGVRTLKNFKYRNANLQITVKGYGNEIRYFLLDGKPLRERRIPASLSGLHTVYIQLSDKMLSGSNHVEPVLFTPETPQVVFHNNILQWQQQSDAINYRIFRNGKMEHETSSIQLPVSDVVAEYQVQAVNKRGLGSFLSEPLLQVPENKLKKIEIESFAGKSPLSYSGFSGEGFVEVSKNLNTIINIPVVIDQAGTYSIDIRYANGNGPINTENKCAIRSVYVDDRFVEAIVLPQRGKGEWSDWGFSNPVIKSLPVGRHVISIRLTPENQNMNGEINEAMLDYIRVIKLN